MGYTDGYILRQLRVWHQLIRQSAIATAIAIESSATAPFPIGAEIKHMLGFFRFNASAWDNLILNLRSGYETYWNHAQLYAGYTLESRNEE